MYILGAGMGGCIAAILNGGAKVLEASKEPPTNHNAVLRFRTDAISKATGIPFKRVTVNKAIFADGQFITTTTPKFANMYSKKVTGKILPRSIWNLSTSERFVAPPDFHSRLIEMVGNRIQYGVDVAHIDSYAITSTVDNMMVRFDRHGQAIISTMPMPILARVTQHRLDEEPFIKLPITTARCSIENCDVNQTIYYPGQETNLYRATLTGSQLIMEFTGEEIYQDEVETDIYSNILPAFGLCKSDLGEIEFGTQKYGKIAPVDSGIRKKFMFDMTREYNIYSLGRFACWRNILLDDVYTDVFTIRRMIEQSHYDTLKGIS